VDTRTLQEVKNGERTRLWFAVAMDGLCVCVGLERAGYLLVETPHWQYDAEGATVLALLWG
jgi:hypothetical protein